MTGAYRFSVTPGETTVMEVEAVLFPRADLNEVGIAPLTSMYSHSPSDHLSNADYRPSVHDSKDLRFGRHRANSSGGLSPILQRRS